MAKNTFIIDLNNFSEWSEFYWIQFEIDNSLEALKKLYLINKESFNTISNDLENNILKLSKANSALNKEDLNSYIQHLYGIEEQIIFEINKIQNSSLIVYAFAIFENKLKMITDKIQKDFTIILPTQKSESFTSNYWKILKCFSKLKVDNIEKYFTPIKCQIIIRNIIVHQNNIATANQYKTIHKLQGLVFNKFDDQYLLVNIEYKFIEQLITRLDTFFRELLNVVKFETNYRIKNL